MEQTDTRYSVILQGMIDESGKLNEHGCNTLTALLNAMPKRVPYEVWLSLKKKRGDVSLAVELVIVRDSKVLLTYRNDAYFKGWHFPGSYMETGESWQDTVQRCADRELKIKVHYIRQLGDVINHPDSKRFHDASVLVLCEIENGEPQAGQWFNECPEKLIIDHKKYWPAVAKHLKS